MVRTSNHNNLCKLLFSIFRHLITSINGGVIRYMGNGSNKINAIIVINLDRKPDRWKRVTRELGRFRTGDGASVVDITHRFSAIDARDGLLVASTGDVDEMYSIEDQLFVQPDDRLTACFALNHPVRMTKQEVAVARSHIEVWKSIAHGQSQFVLVLEDDVWFRTCANLAIDNAWKSALMHSGGDGPRLLYLSYDDKDCVKDRTSISGSLFRPKRGLWFLSGYILSKQGAQMLLNAMPVVGPVDLWMNQRFEELDVLAINSPVILQRTDTQSDNSYSMMPYLARAGTLTASTRPKVFDPIPKKLVLVYECCNHIERLPMALSMIGLRVRTFDDNDEPACLSQVGHFFEEFDVLVNLKLLPDSNRGVHSNVGIRVVTDGDVAGLELLADYFSGSIDTLRISPDVQSGAFWNQLCEFLDVPVPVNNFPVGVSKKLRLFRDDRSAESRDQSHSNHGFDVSPWVTLDWHPRSLFSNTSDCYNTCYLYESLSEKPKLLRSTEETFPGNLAMFSYDSVHHSDNGATIYITNEQCGNRKYRSGAFKSVDQYCYGRFEAYIKSSNCPGLVVGFFLHRARPRQEIDVEFLGLNPTKMLVNVYFNPGDDGAEMEFGYRGTPVSIDLGFDSSLDFHQYAIEWQPNRILWTVDGVVVHERRSWDPTPIPYLPMNLHMNLWIPDSEKFAGKFLPKSAPASALFRDVSVYGPVAF